ncbi:MAG: hypothetical protein MI865_07530 [Proteobacteria bacterium]|nr:hypothetical protein [Pseudomonadota bacterium]
MKNILLVFLVSILGTVTVQANEYPTETTVRYMLNCMADLGGQNDQNLYTCACRYDGIREAMTYSDYEEGITYERNKPMPGKKGAFFRDNQRGEGFYEVLLKVREEANKGCIVVKHVQRPPISEE